MENILSKAFSILLTGMITVLLILGLVVVVGNLLIRITNKFWPLPETNNINENSPGFLTSGTVAAIVAAIETITVGKGKVTKIEKE